jgi:putative DNA primase/helicase
MTLSAADLTRLRRFRIPDELIEQHEIRRVTDREAREDCGIHYRGGDLAGVDFPIFGADGSIKGHRVRRDNPEIENGKLKAKYVQSIDRPHLYFEKKSRRFLTDTSVPVIFVEAYSSALAIAAMSERTGQPFLVVATAGCWGWRGTIGKINNEKGVRVDEKGPSPDLDHIAFAGRKIFVCFDSNVDANSNVQAAERAFRKELEKRGAIVHLARIPGEPNLNGPDDFLAIHQDQDFVEILDNAQVVPTYEWPFELTPDGVLRRIDTEDEETGETKKEWRRICSYLEIDSETRDSQGENWGRILVTKDRDGGLHQWAMPMSMLAGDGAGYREHLLSIGLEIEPGRFPREQLHQYIVTARPDRRARCVTRLGWHRSPESLVYVLPDETFGASHEQVLLQSAWATQHLYRVSGTMKDWKENVAKYCIGNSRLAFAISAAFAPPLMESISESGGGIHYRGTSSTGKTTALRMAGSVWGGGGIDGFIRNWRATSNGLEAAAECHNDALLCLDEISQVDSKEAGETAYMLANGSGKSRAQRDGSSRQVAQWRLLFFSTGEVSLSDKMSETGRQMKAGQEVRLVDIAADAGAGYGIFENLHGFKNADLLAKELRTNSLTYYGSPIREFIRNLTAKPGHLAEAIEKSRAQFINNYVPSDASGQVSRVASRFALIAAAGTLATAMNILPWPEDEAANAAASCFKSFLQQRGTTGARETLIALQQVRKFFQNHGNSRFQDWDSHDSLTINRAGFKKHEKSPDGQIIRTEFFVFPDVFRTEICAGMDAGFVAKELVTRNYLIPGSDGKRCPLQRLPGTQQPSRMYHFSSSILEGSDD